MSKDNNIIYQKHLSFDKVFIIVKKYLFGLNKYPVYLVIIINK